jgi:hypothetical protein
MNVYIQAYMKTCTKICMKTYRKIYMNICMEAYMKTNTNIYMKTYIKIYININMRAYMKTNAKIYMKTHAPLRGSEACNTDSATKNMFRMVRLREPRNILWPTAFLYKP